MLSSRIISEVTRAELKKPTFANSLVVVARNELRHFINLRFMNSLATSSRSPIFVTSAHDGGKMTDQRREFLLQLTDNFTSGLMGRLPLVPMMPIMLSYNVATELGLTNGTMGTLLSIVFDPDAKHARQGRPGQEIPLDKPPLYLLCHFPTAQLLEPFPGLPLNVVPIFPQRLSYRFGRQSIAGFNFRF